MKIINAFYCRLGGADHNLIKDYRKKAMVRYQNMTLALSLTMSTIHGEVRVEITERCSQEEFEVQDATDSVQSVLERCELTMFNLSRNTPLECARKRKRYVRARRVLMRHPYLVGIVTTAGSILLESAVDYWVPSIWQLLNNAIRGLFM